MIAKQILKEPDTEYLTAINQSFYNKSESRNFIIDDINFNVDYKVATIGLNKGYFDASETYLISFSILAKDYTQRIVLKLIDPTWDLKSVSKNEQVINYIPIIVPPAGIKKLYTYSFAFKPNFQKFNKIIFQSLGNYIIRTNKIRIVDVSNVTIQRVATENVLSSSETRKIKEFGIQAQPGFLFTINGEGFHIGRTGMFYLAEDDFIFDSIGICSNTLPFIIDYKIEE